MTSISDDKPAANATAAAAHLSESLNHLLQDIHISQAQCDHLLHTETWQQLSILKNLLCQRPPSPLLPESRLLKIDNVLAYHASHRALTPLASLTPYAVFDGKNRKTPLRLSLWKGDITSLHGVTAIVNAANSALLGCFQPSHKCIDNVIHSVAGPRLRAECARVMAQRGNEPEAVGRATVTPGFALPARYVLHTVGPQLDPRRKGEPSTRQCEELAACYRSCLDAAEALPVDELGRLSVVFCCISTGLFAFPGRVAARIAVDEVIRWISAHPDTPITDVVFDVFLEEDRRLYLDVLANAELPREMPLQASGHAIPATTQENRNMRIAKEWLSQADYCIITAGAGLSASAGLDYGSTALFDDYYAGFPKIGLRRVGDFIGFDDWPDTLTEWGFQFVHLEMVRSWPKSQVYQTLLTYAKRFGDRYFVRTSNADGLFDANDFPQDRLSTPQGHYKYLQCYNNCRPTAVFETSKYLDAALPATDPETQVLTDPSLIPTCEYCGGDLTLCVRGGDYFNDTPFRAQNKEYRNFVDRIRDDAPEKKTVVIELGVGMNTPSVVRWPNEELVEEGDGRFRLIRIGLDASGCVPWDLEGSGLAVGIEGDISAVISNLL